MMRFNRLWQTLTLVDKPPLHIVGPHLAIACGRYWPRYDVN